MLSRLPDLESINPENNDDYLDVIVASITDHEQHNRLSHPVTVINDNQFHCTEQNKDVNIKWIKDLINEHKENKPRLIKFNNKIQGALYKEYANLCLIDDILYRQVEDQLGINKIQYVLPEHEVSKVIAISIAKRTEC